MELQEIYTHTKETMNKSIEAMKKNLALYVVVKFLLRF